MSLEIRCLWSSNVNFAALEAAVSAILTIQLRSTRVSAALLRLVHGLCDIFFRLSLCLVLMTVSLLFPLFHMSRSPLSSFPRLTLFLCDNNQNLLISYDW
jgi:hypothetical protein